MRSPFSLLFAVVALLGGATAQLTVLAPGGSNLWWVDNSLNTLVWTCHTSQNPFFNVIIANPNVNLLTAPLPILSSVDNSICSKSVLANLFNLPPGTGYTLQLSNIFNDSDIYTTSQPFELKALGSAYPNPSSTPTIPGTASSTSSGSTSSSTTTSGSIKASVSGLAALAAMVMGITMF